MKIIFFPTPKDLRKWFSENHQATTEVWVGFYKKGTGHPSITWPESVDEALCYGWIDGIRKRIDEVSYKIRFTPRRARSIWSAINIKRVAVLTDEGRMQPPGIRAFQAREENRSGIYAYEQRHEGLAEPYEKMLRQNQAAWDYFQAQPPHYRNTVGWWVVSAKQEATRLKRLARLIEDCVQGRWIKHLTRKKPGT